MKPLDVEALLASGAVEGPYTLPHPVTLSTCGRLMRALRVFFINRRSPL